MSGLERALEAFSNFLMVIAGIAITAMMLHIAADIVAKSVFHRPIIATLEIVTWYYMVATVFLPVAYIQIHKKHLMVELFTLNMSARRLAVLEGAVGVLGAVYVGILCYLTFGHAIDQTEAGEIQDATFFDLPVWPSRWMLPVAVGAMALVFVTQSVRDLVYGITGRGTPSTRPKEGLIIEEE